MTAVDTTFAQQAMSVLFQHRMATTGQLKRLLAPTKSGEATRRRLAALREQNLIDHITLPQPGRTRIWFLTDYGRQICADWPELRGTTCPPVAADPTAVRLRTAHTVTVLRTHLAFLEEARVRGDEYGLLDWIPEKFHKITDQRDDAVIADALLRYTATTPQGRVQYRAFVEVDRATMSSERLAAKLIGYARFLDYAPVPPGRRSAVQAQNALPAWQRHYPLFPRVLFVITAIGQAGLNHRIEDLRAMAAGHPLAAHLVDQVPVGVARLEDLEEHGPSAPVWTALDGRAQPCGWMEL